MSVVLFSATAVLIVPFIKIYTSGITDVDYEQPLFAILITLVALSYCLRLPYHSMVIAAGHFKETSTAAYGEAFINIVLSVLCVWRFGLVGVAAATLAATWFRFIYYVIYLSKNIIYRKVSLFIKRLVINTATVGINCALGYYIITLWSLTNYLSWALGGAVLTAVLCVLTLGVNMCFFPEDCKVFVRKFIKV